MACSWRILLASLVAVLLTGMSDGSIRCHQCDDCPDAKNLKTEEECKKVTYMDGLVRLAAKKAKMNEDMIRQGMAQARAEMKKMGGDAAKSADELEKALSKPPVTCFKMAMMIDKEEIVFRGCGHDTPNECRKEEGVDVCICRSHGCNQAKKEFGSVLLITCLFLLISYLNV